MDALLRGMSSSKPLPHLQDWLNLAAPVRQIIETKYTHLKDDAARQNAAGEENVLFALENLHSYHCVQERLADGSLSMHGWFFNIATAELFAFDPEAQQFKPLVPQATG